MATELGVPCTVIEGEELQEKGFGGIYGVGKVSIILFFKYFHCFLVSFLIILSSQAAIVPPALVTLSYTPPNATQTIAWVGKGIVYDTGGLSIKGKVRKL